MRVVPYFHQVFAAPPSVFGRFFLFSLPVTLPPLPLFGGLGRRDFSPSPFARRTYFCFEGLFSPSFTLTTPIVRSSLPPLRFRNPCCFQLKPSAAPHLKRRLPPPHGLCLFFLSPARGPFFSPDVSEELASLLSITKGSRASGPYRPSAHLPAPFELLT